MIGKTKKEISGWTVDTLHTYMQRQLTDLRTLLDERKHSQEEGVRSALLTAKEAVLKQEAASEKRFESVNEFRAQLTDQAATFLTRTESELEQLRVNEKIQQITDRLNRTEGRGIGMNAAFAYVIAALSILISIYVGTR